MNEHHAIELIEGAGAILEGHFVGASGKHYRQYIAKGRVLSDPVIASRLCRAIANPFLHGDIDSDIEVVVGSGDWGILIASKVAHHLQRSGFRTKAAYVKKAPGGGFTLPYELEEDVRGKRALVVEDILTTGETVMRVCSEIRRLDAEIIAVSGLWNRGGIHPKHVGVPRMPFIINKQLESWDVPSGKVLCQPCVEGIPVNPRFGRGAEYLAGLAGFAGRGE